MTDATSPSQPAPTVAAGRDGKAARPDGQAAGPDVVAEPDGRRARRQRNREAVVDAMLALYREGVPAPSSEEIASRAGVSSRSIFRYFADVDDLAREAVARQQEHLLPLWRSSVDPAAPLGERIAAFVAHRVALVEAMGEVGRVARVRAARQPLIAAELRRVRHGMRAQAAAAFAPELDDLAPAARTGLLAAIDALTSWEAHDLMRNDQRLDDTATRAALELALGRLLAPAPVAAHGPADRPGADR